MKIGASISGGAHAVLIGLAIFSGEIFASDVTRPINIAEVELMSGPEFEAAQSTSPEFNADQPASLRSPETSEEIADVKLAETDAAPSTLHAPEAPDAPQQGEAVQPLEEPADVAIAEIGAQPAAPLAPEGDILIAAVEPTPDLAPVTETPIAASPAPSSRPRAPDIDTSSPVEAPEPVVTAVAAPTAAPATVEEPEVSPPEPEPEPQVAQAPAVSAPTTLSGPQVDTSAPEPEPEPEDPPAEEEVATLNDPDIPVPKVAPPPPRKPTNIAEAKRAERLARQAQEQAETGATQSAAAPTSTGTSQTVGRVSFRDREALRVGIRGQFNPPQGLRNADQLAVTIRVELSQDGKIVGRPEVRRPSGRLDAQHNALMRAGVRALQKSAAKGVFARLPKDKYARWRRIDVTFTPKEIRFL